jgi:RNA polymerase sigma factor (sigma-70 family)
VLIEDEPGVRAAIDSLPAARESEPDEQLRRGEARRLVQVALDQLPARYGDALEWKYIEGRSTREIADRLAIGSEAAQSLLARARRAFAPVYRSLVNGLDSAEAP